MDLWGEAWDLGTTEILWEPPKGLSPLLQLGTTEVGAGVGVDGFL